eukprot:scaffold28342_cov57-Phaeocystis_antarctica.AAC.3
MADSWLVSAHSAASPPPPPTSLSRLLAASVAATAAAASASSWLVDAHTVAASVAAPMLSAPPMSVAMPPASSRSCMGSARLTMLREAAAACSIVASTPKAARAGAGSIALGRVSPPLPDEPQHVGSLHRRAGEHGGGECVEGPHVLCRQAERSDEGGRGVPLSHAAIAHEQRGEGGELRGHGGGGRGEQRHAQRRPQEHVGARALSTAGQGLHQTFLRRVVAERIVAGGVGGAIGLRCRALDAPRRRAGRGAIIGGDEGEARRHVTEGAHHARSAQGGHARAIAHGGARVVVGRRGDHAAGVTAARGGGGKGEPVEGGRVVAARHAVDAGPVVGARRSVEVVRHRGHAAAPQRDAGPVVHRRRGDVAIGRGVGAAGVGAARVGRGGVAVEVEREGVGAARDILPARAVVLGGCGVVAERGGLCAAEYRVAAALVVQGCEAVEVERHRDEAAQVGARRLGGHGGDGVVVVGGRVHAAHHARWRRGRRGRRRRRRVRRRRGRRRCGRKPGR